MVFIFVAPCFIAEAAYKIWWYTSGATAIPFLGNAILSDAVACTLELASWLYRTVVFFLVCVLFRLICHLQILRLQDFAQVFHVDSDVESVLKEHLRIRRHLRIISHRYRVFIMWALILVTISQFTSLLDTTRSTADLDIFKTGELALVSVSLLAGIMILLRSATRITHMAQGDTETPPMGVLGNQLFSSNGHASASDNEEDVGSEDELESTKLIPAYARSTISFQKRQALAKKKEDQFAVMIAVKPSSITDLAVRFNVTTDNLFISEIESNNRKEEETQTFDLGPGLRESGILISDFRLQWILVRLRSIGVLKNTRRFIKIGSFALTQVSPLFPSLSSPRALFQISIDCCVFSDFEILDGDGRITGTDATKFFAMSNLSRQDLKQVWAIADSKRQGFLGFKEFVTAMQLISLAQAGHTVSSDLVNSDINAQDLNPPAMEGLDILLSVRSSQIEISASGKYSKKTNSDFDAKPMVMLLGQYSTGKTTFIKHLLRSGYPGAHIGPEPTTDRFVAVMNGTDERSIPGNTVAVQADMPFNGLTSFGSAFLSKFECSQMAHPLMRVYGALMWSLGKVLNTPEVMRVYIGSFNDKPINAIDDGPLGAVLFEKEQDDLLNDLKDIPKKACDRRVS
ncbi:hypothetical protein SSX86_024560 [Deinandra increscens subsp. villosa]|uniref:EH domain-containing protein 1 n=1 Tax=Deinandra increscens subsp. villosa TaxID=3103831 RepID=A0AAP0GNQ3_9ASTR